MVSNWSLLKEGSHKGRFFWARRQLGHTHARVAVTPRQVLRKAKLPHGARGLEFSLAAGGAAGKARPAERTDGHRARFWCPLPPRLVFTASAELAQGV